MQQELAYWWGAGPVEERQTATRQRRPLLFLSDKYARQAGHLVSWIHWDCLSLSTYHVSKPAGNMHFCLVVLLPISKLEQKWFLLKSYFKRVTSWEFWQVWVAPPWPSLLQVATTDYGNPKWLHESRRAPTAVRSWGSWHHRKGTSPHSNGHYSQEQPQSCGFEDPDDQVWVSTAGREWEGTSLGGGPSILGINSAQISSWLQATHIQDGLQAAQLKLREMNWHAMLPTAWRESAFCDQPS